MPSNYTLKNNPLSKNRLRKLAKELLEESSADRQRATQAFDYFQKKVDDFHTDREMREVVTSAERCMVEALKVINDSRSKTIKALELLVKLETSNTKPDGKEEEEEIKYTFEDLDE